jgi:hypothetical protein
MALLRGALTVLMMATVSLRDCGNPTTDQAVITGMGFSPSNPVGGDPTELWVAYNLKSPITGGTATYSLNLNGIPFTPTVNDLCTQTSCPKDAGTYNETSKSEFPSGVSGKIISKIAWTNQDSQPVWCLESTFRI